MQQQIMNSVSRILLFCLLLLSPLSGSARADDTEQYDFLDDSFYEAAPEQIEVADPLEPFNRVMFKFNDYMYTWVMEPLASSYSQMVPADVREAAAHFCYNFQEPVRFVNALLQFRFADAGTLLVRFTVNTIAGVGGLGDPAERELGFKAVEAGLGETLATWGIGDGFYLVIPSLGATTLREFSGSVLDSLSMTPYYFLADSFEEAFAIYMSKELNKVSLRLGDYEDVTQMSVDPYTAFRDGYFQRRKQARKHSAPIDDKI